MQSENTFFGEISEVACQSQNGVVFGKIVLSVRWCLYTGFSITKKGCVCRLFLQSLHYSSDRDPLGHALILEAPIVRFCPNGYNGEIPICVVGTLVNAAAVLLGGGIGLLLKGRIPARFAENITRTIGLCVCVIGINGAINGEAFGFPKRNKCTKLPSDS